MHGTKKNINSYTAYHKNAVRKQKNVKSEYDSEIGLVRSELRFRVSRLWPKSSMSGNLKFTKPVTENLK